MSGSSAVGLRDAGREAPTADEVRSRQRRKNLAIALSVVFLCVLFYVITVVRLQQGLQ